MLPDSPILGTPKILGDLSRSGSSSMPPRLAISLDCTILCSRYSPFLTKSTRSKLTGFNQRKSESVPNLDCLLLTCL